MPAGVCRHEGQNSVDPGGLGRTSVAEFLHSQGALCLWAPLCVSYPFLVHMLCVWGQVTPAGPSSLRFQGSKLWHKRAC